MGNHGARSHGMEEAPVTLEDSVNGMLSKVRNLIYAFLHFFFWEYIKILDPLNLWGGTSISIQVN